MKNITRRNVYIGLIALCLGIILGWLFFSGSAGYEQSNNSNHVAAKEEVWTCSMHPQIRKSESGQCPICGMDLIPVNGAGFDSDNTMEIRMSPTAMQLANVQTSIVSKQKPIKEVRMNGKVTVDERKIASQTAHIPGRIEQLMVGFTGESVQKGQVLAYVYSPELVTAQEELFESYKMREVQPHLYEATKEKLKNWKLTTNQIASILKKGVIQEQFPILADVSGIVLKKKVHLGDYIQKGQSIYEIANLSKVWVSFDLYESDLAWVNVGDKVTFSIQSIPNVQFSGNISFIDPIINPKTRVASGRVEISNSGLHLKPDMFVYGIVKSPIEQQSESIIVPRSAIMWTGERSIVYVKNTTSSGISFEMREVSLGGNLGDTYIISDGLEIGEEIATNGTFSIDAAAQLAGKPSMMNTEGGMQMTGHDHGGATTKNQTDLKPKNNKVVTSHQIKAEINPLVREYFILKDKLIADNLSQAIISAKEMNTLVSEVNMTAFSGEAHDVWMMHSSLLKKDLINASLATEIGQLRVVFKSISDRIVIIVKTFNVVESPIYLKYCPMANDDRGAYWLSTKKKITNPYFGKSMLRCGEVKEKIN